MNKYTTLRRQDFPGVDTSLRYRIVHLGHWSEIVNVDDDTDVHHVKWYGRMKDDQLFVSAPQGLGFTTKDCEELEP